MFRVLVISGGKKVPSSIFRVRQYLPFINDYKSIKIVEQYPFLECYTSYKGILRLFYYIIYLISRSDIIFKQFNYDAIFLQREILPTFFTLERFLFKPIIYDVDDAVFIGDRQSLTQRRISEKASMVIVSNNYLKNWYDQYSKKVIIIPTSVNIERYKPIKLPKLSNTKIIGWIGTSNNFWHLDLVINSVSKFLISNPCWKLRIVADKDYKSDQISADKIENIKWTLDSDVKLINSFDIGIMPLVETNWTVGKSAFKLVQYMACGIPCLASDVGVNKVVGKDIESVKLLSDNGWYDALCEFSNKKFIDNKGREKIIKEYSIQKNSKILIKILNEIYYSCRK